MALLVSEVFRKTKTGGKGICTIYQSSGLGRTFEIDDVTEEVAEMMGYKHLLKKGSLHIPYGSGTGFMRISNYFYERKKEGGADIVVVNVSAKL